MPLSIGVVMAHTSLDIILSLFLSLFFDPLLLLIRDLNSSLFGQGFNFSQCHAPVYCGSGVRRLIFVLILVTHLFATLGVRTAFFITRIVEGVFVVIELPNKALPVVYFVFQLLYRSDALKCLDFISKILIFVLDFILILILRNSGQFDL